MRKGSTNSLDLLAHKSSMSIDNLDPGIDRPVYCHRLGDCFYYRRSFDQSDFYWGNYRSSFSVFWLPPAPQRTILAYRRVYIKVLPRLEFEFASMIISQVLAAEQP